ncbi:unnamed protein product [Notodromas monacha]|uniref:DUF4211 domain-containing protein n=1 Tax=Notodromas monacha TaxID=399045 RepID=A0A7R9GFJ7_9CRUS|nr:unnamed protein product [Notodromas monacha]CAG0920758.1 unnamed protein product [Notodromas monacha]
MEPGSWSAYQSYANSIAASQANQLSSNFHSIGAHHAFSNVGSNPNAAHSGVSSLGKEGGPGVLQGAGLGGGHGSVRPLSPWQSMIPFASIHPVVDQEGVRKHSELVAAEQKKQEERRMAEERRAAEERRLAEERRHQAERERRDREEREQRRINAERIRLEQQQRLAAASMAAMEHQRRALAEQHKLPTASQSRHQPQQRIVEQNKRYGSASQQYGSTASQPVFPTNATVYVEPGIYNPNSSKNFHVTQQSQASPAMTGSPSSRPGSGSGNGLNSNTNGQLSSPCAFEGQQYGLAQSQQSIPFNFSTNQISQQGEAYFQQNYVNNASNFSSNSSYHAVLNKGDERSNASPRNNEDLSMPALQCVEVMRSPSPSHPVLINLDSKSAMKRKSSSVKRSSFITLQNAAAQQAELDNYNTEEGSGPSFAPNIFMNPYDGNFQPVVQFPPAVMFPPHGLGEQASGTGISQQQTQCAVKEEPQVNSKIVTPDAESTLGFLASKPGAVAKEPVEEPEKTRSNGMNVEHKPVVSKPSTSAPAKSGASAGFHDSFLKFLKGEKEEPEPPPKVIKKPYIPPPSLPRPPPPPPTVVAQSPPKPAVSAVSTPVVKPIKISTRGMSTGPRGGATPGRGRGAGRGGSRGAAAGVTKPRGSTTPRGRGRGRGAAATPVLPRGRGGGGGSGGGRGRRKRKADSDDDEIVITEEIIPKRETSRRQAKEKAKEFKFRQVEDELDEEEAFDSDTDPAWMPSAKPGLGIHIGSEDDGFDRDGKHKILKDARARQRAFEPPSSPSSPVVASRPADKAQIDNIDPLKDEDSSNFKVGSMVMMKSDFPRDTFPVWKIERNSLIRYEPMTSIIGERLYKKTSMDVPWSISDKDNLEPLDFEAIDDQGKDSIVRISIPLALEIRNKFFESSMASSTAFLDSFEVYIQSLISQALDANFLTEIIRDDDKYFTEKIAIIDSECQKRRQVVTNICGWNDMFRESVDAWPCVNFVSCNKPPEPFVCGACAKNVAPFPRNKTLLQLFGQRYDGTTLKNLAPPESAEELPKRQYEICRECETLVAEYARVVHLKYDLYGQCASRVTSIRAARPEMESTVILNTLLAEEKWVQKMFKGVQRNWARLDKTTKLKDLS